MLATPQSADDSALLTRFDSAVGDRFNVGLPGDTNNQFGGSKRRKHTDTAAFSTPLQYRRLDTSQRMGLDRFSVPQNAANTPSTALDSPFAARFGQPTFDIANNNNNHNTENHENKNENNNNNNDNDNTFLMPTIAPGMGLSRSQNNSPLAHSRTLNQRAVNEMEAKRIRKQRHNEGESRRRKQMNQQMETLAKMLGVEKASRPNILKETLKQLAEDRKSVV